MKLLTIAATATLLTTVYFVQDSQKIEKAQIKKKVKKDFLTLEQKDFVKEMAQEVNKEMMNKEQITLKKLWSVSKNKNLYRNNEKARKAVKAELELLKVESKNKSIKAEVNKYISAIDAKADIEEIKLANDTQVHGISENEIRLKPEDFEAFQDKISFTRAAMAYFTNQNDTYTCQNITTTNPSTTGDALTGSDIFTQRTSEVVELANKLATPQKAFQFVKNFVRFMPLYGAGQSASQVMTSKKGTSLDKASLLVALLRSQGTPAVYRTGEILIDEDKLMRLYETEDNEELAIAHVSLLSKYLSSPGINPYDRLVYYKEGKRRWVMPHTWVLAYIDGQWIELDPTNTDKELSGPLNIASSDRAGESNIVDWLSSVQRGSIVDRLTRENRNSPLPRVGEEHINGRSENDFEMGSVGYSQCIENQSAFIPQNYQFRVGITAHTMNINLPLPNFISGTVSLTHTTGLLGESVGSSGLLQLKSEGDILSQISINKGQLVNVTREITYPSRYSDLVNLRPSQRITGGVSVFDISPYGGVQKELENQIAHLRDLKASGATSQQRMVALLKLAGIMYRVRHEELSHDLQHIRGFRAITLHNSEVLTSSGTLVTRDDRVLGEIPVLTTIDIRGSSNTYFIDRTFNDTDFLDIWRERAVLGSELEHLVWEELYGISAASSIRVIQEKAQENLSNVIMGQVAKPSNINTITSQLASNLNSLPQGIINNIVVFGESEIYVPRDRLILSSGWEGGAYLMIGKNGGFAAIIYTFVSARTTSNGGVGTGTTDDAGEASEDVLTEAPRQGTSCPPGNPVVVATGAMYHVFNDFEVAGRTPNTSLKFVRTYLTKSKGNLGDLGGKWTHNYEERLEFPFSNKVIYFDDLGGGASFTKNGASFVSPKGNFSTLTEFTDRYELTEKGGVVKVFSKGDTLIPDGRLLKIRDPHGEEVTLNYTAGILTSVSAPLAGTISFVRNGDGKIEQVVRERDSLTNIYQYDLSGNLISHIDVDSNIEQYEYVDDMPGTQAQGLLEKVIDKKGVTAIEFSYYENGQVFEDKTPLGGKLTYQYSPFFDRNFTRMTGTEGQVTEFLMDEEFRQIETVFANRSRRQVEWTNDNLVASITDELGAKTEFTYDARGNRTGVKRPEYSSYSTITYDQTYDIPTQINPLVGSPTTITLDPNDGDITNILRIDSQGNLNLDFTHDQFGNILQTNNGLASYTNVTNNDGELTSLFDSRNSEGRQYDSHHRLWKRTFSNGREITLGYDDLNRVTSVTDTNGPDITQIFDELGQLTSRTVSGNGESQTTTYEWDDRNRLVAIVDPVGRRTEIEYELYSVGCGTIDKPTLIRDPAGRVTQMIYNNMARLIAVVDPLGNKTKFFYNLRGDRIGVQDLAGNLTRFEYDGNRRLVKRIRPVTRTGERNKSVLAEQVTRFFYNEADQLVREETDLLALTNGTNKGKLATELTYNLIDRVSRKVIKEEFMGDVTIKDDSNFTYSRQLDVTRLATANNQTVNLTFDYENVPPFSITNYSTASVDTS
jgi:YD repeat-containing protein